ncbi:beta-lactamase-like protein [Paraphysoderma sedebokerense]|nr:beta-lactamase-like protein [Paraphysoderma sedebokerense]
MPKEKIQVLPLGAGQDVGRSCIIVSLGGKTIMFDCGMHMGYSDERRFPDFTRISKTEDYTSAIDVVIVTHFHLDHCGSLPYFTEVKKYNGPIIMTHPTKAICPILLEDYRKISVDKRGMDESDFFTVQHIKDCMKKVIAVNVHQSIYLDGDDNFEIKCYYAGHVLGAAMFYVRVGEQSVVYTGDYNMTPDRHLGSAWIDKCRPDVLITETTYATTIRDSKRARERDFLKKVHDCISGGGKVLIPVFAIGRAQELCILLESYWERMNLKTPIYFSGGLTERANQYYKLFINWTNQKIKDTLGTRNMFDFKHIKSYDKQFASLPGPQVLFATPGMLHSGFSLEIFKKWCSDPKNMIIMPGYCVAGTVGAKVLSGQKRIQIDRTTTVTVNMKVRNLSFSAHADAKGIMQLIQMCEPRNVVLVHGEKQKMGRLKDRIMGELGIPCFDPGNFDRIEIETNGRVNMDMSNLLLNLAKREHYERVGRGLKVDSKKGKAWVDESKEELRRIGLSTRISVDKDTVVKVHGILVKKEIKLDISNPLFSIDKKPDLNTLFASSTSTTKPTPTATSVPSITSYNPSKISTETKLHQPSYHLLSREEFINEYQPILGPKIDTSFTVTRKIRFSNLNIPSSINTSVSSNTASYPMDTLYSSPSPADIPSSQTPNPETQPDMQTVLDHLSLYLTQKSSLSFSISPIPSIISTSQGETAIGLVVPETSICIQIIDMLNEMVKCKVYWRLEDDDVAGKLVDML